MRWAGILAAGIFAAGACLISAQPSDEVRVSAHAYIPPQLKLTAQTTLVQLEVVVRDPRGHAVGGLKQGDFEILDEGKPRAISGFSVETREAMLAVAAPLAAGPDRADTMAAPHPAPAPRSTLLFFDDLHVTPAEFQRTQIAAKRLVKDGMGPGARAAIYAAHEGLILDFTSDADALAAAIQKLHSHQRISENGLQPCPRITPYTAYLIDHLYDYSALNAAVQEAESCSNSDPTLKSNVRVQRNPTPGSPHFVAVNAVQAQASQTMQQVRTDSLASFDAIDKALALLERAPGARVLLMVSSGFLAGMLDTDRAEVIDRAIHSGIVINALDAKALWTESPGRVSETAGALPLETFIFETSTIGSRNAEMNSVMQEFASGTGGLFFHDNNDLASGFSLLGAVPETTYLIAFSPDAEVAAGQYRKLKVRLTSKNDDYIQTRPGYVTPATAAAPAPRPIDQEAAASDVLTAIPVQLTARLGKSQNGDQVVSTLIHVDLRQLKFSASGERHIQKLMFIGELLDAGGKIVAAKEGAMDLALKDDTLARLTASGVNAGLTFAAPAGPYRVRVVVQDAEGKMAAQNQTVEMPN